MKKRNENNETWRNENNEIFHRNCLPINENNEKSVITVKRKSKWRKIFVEMKKAIYIEIIEAGSEISTSKSIDNRSGRRKIESNVIHGWKRSLKMWSHRNRKSSGKCLSKENVAGGEIKSKWRKCYTSENRYFLHRKKTEEMFLHHLPHFLEIRKSTKSMSFGHKIINQYFPQHRKIRRKWRNYVFIRENQKRNQREGYGNFLRLRENNRNEKWKWREK